ncbi:hypothetical protein Gpo141_00001109 [Globisporangium polare]
MHRQPMRRLARAPWQTQPRSAFQQIAALSSSSPSSSSSSNVVFQRYRSLVDEGKITYDPVQVCAVRHFDLLYDQLAQYGGPTRNAAKAAHSSWWQRLTGSDLISDAATDSHETATTPKGLYIHGGVGCGKTFVMDMFFDAVPIEKKMRVHFHKFMLDIHKKMHQLRVEGRREDPIPFIADDLLRNSWLLCFDEFQVTDVADALILRRLFSALLERDFVMVATSNRPPSELYKNGLQRDLFLPFIDLLSEKCDVVSLVESETDYRAVKGAHHAHNVYNFPLTPEARASFDYEFDNQCQGEEPVETHLSTQGRRVRVPLAAVEAGVCQFSFDDLCGKPLGAADYIAIAKSFSVIFVRDIPILKLEMINQMRRFITFVDCMYDKGVRLHCLAGASAIDLYQLDGASKSHVDEVFAFDRTVSRLLEMGSEAYLEAHNQQRANSAPKDGSDLYLEAAEDDDGENSTSTNNTSKADDQDGEAVVV